ncbi:MAG: lytic transglycosylase domain-containing protein [Candidatus Latescibacteria bacterium]|jgi:soluble lytic murein transglycosylase-like protein|nr:lytic transglycosylase domain-containing protein [Candidatus Latescibacterota bacterium]
MKLISLLICLVVLLQFSVSADASEKKSLHPNIFYQRSVAPSLISLILSRSTGRLAPVDKRSVDSAPEFENLEPLQLVSIPVPKLEKQQPTVRSSKLNSNILKRLMVYDPIVRHYSRLHDLDPNLTRAVIYVESGGLIDARSHKGARGLMQLMPGTAAEMGVKNPLNPTQNIFGGTRYLSRMLERFGRLDLALWAYNAGPESVKRKRPPLETRRYIPKVIGIKRLLDQGDI